MFKLIKIDNARMNVPEPEYYVCGASITCGQALYLDGYSLKLGGYDTNFSRKNPVEFIAMADGKNGETIPVCRVNNAQVWETTAEGSESLYGRANPGTTVIVSQDRIVQSGSGDSLQNSHAIVVSKGEAFAYDTNGNATSGYVRIRFLCNFGMDASDGKTG